MTNAFVSIFIGSGLGGVLRYALQLILHERIVACSFPWTTFAVNILGSFLIGLFYAVSSRLNLSNELRLFLTVGLCGGFTTFSTFGNDVLALIRQGDVLIGLIYVCLSVVLGVLACCLGGMLCKS